MRFEVQVFLAAFVVYIALMVVVVCIATGRGWRP